MSEPEVIFSLNGVKTKIKCNKEDLMKDILEKYKTKDNVDISSMYLLYKGNKVNPFITFKEQLAEEDKKKNAMEISCIQMGRRNTVRKSSKRKKELLNSSFRKSNYRRSATKRINISDRPKTLKTEKDKELTTESKKANYNKNYIKKKSLFKPEPKKEPVKNEALYDNGFNFNKMFNYNDFFRAYSCQINLTENNEKTPVINEYISNEVIQRNTEAVNNDKTYEGGNKIYPSSEKKLEKEFEEFQIKFDIINNKIRELINILTKINDNINSFYEITFDKINNCETVQQDNKIFNDFKTILNNYTKFIDDMNVSIIDNKISKTSEKFNTLMNAYKDTNKDIIKYKINDGDKMVKIFGAQFVVNNWDNCTFLCEDNEYKLAEFIDLQNLKRREKTLEIKLKIKRDLRDISFMFSDCSSLISISKSISWKTENVTSIRGMFAGCTSLKTLPDLSLMDTSKVKNMRGIFAGCESLTSLPDISKWNTDNVTDMQYMFHNCNSLKTLPEISKWNTSNVTDMRCMFYNCSSLTSVPDISKWSMKKVSNIQSLFEGCSKLSTLPNIGKWDLPSNVDMRNMFKNCKRSLKIPLKFRKYHTTIRLNNK
jgi:surface protein